MSITYDHKELYGGDPAKPVFMHRITIAYAAETYATGGIEVDLTDSGLDDLFTDHNVLAVVDLGGSGYIAQYDYATGYLKVYFADYDAGADGALIEFTDTGSLTATFTLLLVTY